MRNGRDVNVIDAAPSSWNSLLENVHDSDS